MDGGSMLSVKQAAAYVCVCETVVRGWLQDGLPHFRLGATGRRGHIRIVRDDLDAWLANFKVTTRQPEPAQAPALPRSVFKHLRLS